MLSVQPAACNNKQVFLLAGIVDRPSNYVPNLSVALSQLS